MICHSAQNTLLLFGTQGNHPTTQVTFSSINYQTLWYLMTSTLYILGYQTLVSKHSGHDNSYNGSWRILKHTHHPAAASHIFLGIHPLWYPWISDQPLPIQYINRPGWTLIHPIRKRIFTRYGVLLDTPFYWYSLICILILQASWTPYHRNAKTQGKVSDPAR